MDCKLETLNNAIKITKNVLTLNLKICIRNFKKYNELHIKY